MKIPGREIRRSRPRMILFVAAIVVTCGLLGMAGQDAAKGVRYVLEYYDNGQAKTQIKAGSVVPGDASIKAQNVRGECYTEDGKLDVLILAKNCEYTKDELLVVSDSDVTVEKDDITLSGTGFKWDGKEQVVEIKSRVKLAFLRKGSIRSALGRAGEGKRSVKKEAMKK